jgi:cytochrome c biogenesis protein CcmG/thiol:disulfide interchange protein DsbE
MKRSVIAVITAVPLIALLAWGLRRDPSYIPSPLPGRDAPAFSLEVFATGEQSIARSVGDTLSSGEMRGNVLVINFWASWCLACRDEHAALSEVALMYSNRPVKFVGVLYQDRTAAALEWISRMGGQSYPSVNDPRSRTAIAFGLYGVPETFIVDRAGKVAHKQVGPVTRGLLVRLIDSLLFDAESAGSLDGDRR